MIEAIVRRTLVERALIERGDHVLVACSGGPDSTALLDVLHRLRNDLGITLVAGSIDHGLRHESAAEVAAVGEFAESLGVPFHAARVELAKSEPSLQARARVERYASLQRIADRVGAARIAVGHTQDDQAETVLSRVLRGSGLRGLAGIEPRRADRVIRPLIDCSRADVRSHAEWRRLPFFEDPSNRQMSFERSRIRHNLLPRLLHEDPQVVAHLAALADQAAEINAWIEGLLPDLPSKGELRTAISPLLAEPPPVRALWLQRWIRRETGIDVHRPHLMEIGRLLQGRGEVLLGAGWSIRPESGDLLLEYRARRRTRSNRL